MEYIHKDGEFYFAAANTAFGFKSCFENIFNIRELDKLYILKGGPGVGKSTFMKKIAQHCEKIGFTVEYFLCSSDPESLDGIIIKDLRYAIVDGTSPHTLEPTVAGAFEEIIDLGKAWDTDRLITKRDELISLVAQKKACYKNAYDFLYVCRQIKSILENNVHPHICTDKLNKSAKRLAKSILFREATGTGQEKVRYIDAISCKGKMHLCSFEDKAKMCVFIKESKPLYGIGPQYMRLVYQEAKKKGTAVIVSYSPLDTSEIDGLYFVKEQISVTPYHDSLTEKCDRQGKKCRIVNVSRFLDSGGEKKEKAERKFLEKLYEAVEEKALEELKKAGETHLLLEKIYSTCTDYGIVEKIREDFLKKLPKARKSRQ